MKRAFFVSAGMVLGLVLSGVAAGVEEDSKRPAAAIPLDQAEGIAARGYIFGFPLVIMDRTARTMTAVPAPQPDGRAPMNQFGHMRKFPTAAFKDVIRPNVDTLYSSAWLDLSKEPVVLSVPDTHGRYYVMEMLDAWTNVFASPGKRTTGTKAAAFGITGPGWKGTLPDGVRQIKSPTNLAWILGRTQTNGPEDYAAVHAIQDQYQLTPLSAMDNPQIPPAATAVAPNTAAQSPPLEQVSQMDAQAFFSALAELMAANPPSPEDAAAITNLMRLGVVAGRPFDLKQLDPAVAERVENIVKTAPAQMQEAARKIGTFVNGWNIPPTNLGNYGTDYGTRAIVAAVGIGANLTADALYPTTFVDGNGDPLNGQHRYTIHFEKGRTPPVNAFWSITLYGPDSLLAANPIDRYAISSWMPLKYNDDGSLDLTIQRDSSGPDREANWLPAPKGDFNLTLRIYWPEESALEGQWKPPAVTRIEQ